MFDIFGDDEAFDQDYAGFETDTAADATWEDPASVLETIVETNTLEEDTAREAADEAIRHEIAMSLVGGWSDGGQDSDRDGIPDASDWDDGQWGNSGNGRF